jgi:hypothetical protein
VITLLAACARPPLAATELYRPPVTVEVTEATVATDRHGPPDWPGTVYETTTSYADGRASSVTRYVVGPRGVAYFATVTGEDERLFAPKVALPPWVRPRDRWEGLHGDNDRSCVAERTPFCRDGVATACTTAWDDRATWMRQHWCPGLGWAGFELVTVSAGGTWATSFSTDVRKDGVSLPAVPLEDRRVPSPDRLTLRGR